MQYSDFNNKVILDNKNNSTISFTNLRKEQKNKLADEIVTTYNVVKTLVIDENGLKVNEFMVNEEYTVYPGASTTFNLISRIEQQNVVVCEEMFRNITSSFAPSLNAAGVFTVFSQTDFANPQSNGEVKYGYNTTANPLVLSIWDPSITQYNITAFGNGCMEYEKDLQKGTFILNVRHLQPNELIFDPIRNVCPSLSYDTSTNRAGLIGKNPVFNTTGCTIVFKVEKAPYKVEFGFLQLVESGALGVVSNAAKDNSFVTLATESKTVDSYRDFLGNYFNMMNRTIVSQNGYADLVYNSTRSIFAAPYFSKDCNSTQFEQSEFYNYDNIQFDNYLMMRVIDSKANNSWVPIRKINWSINDFDLRCKGVQACGTGLGNNSSQPFSNTNWITSGSITPPINLDKTWIQKPTLPQWNGIFQDAFKGQLSVRNATNTTQESFVLCSVGATDGFDVYGTIYNKALYYNLYLKYALDTHGNWIDKPSDIIYSEEKSNRWVLGNTNKQNIGTEGDVQYYISFLSPSAYRGSFTVKFADPKSGSNSCSLSVSYEYEQYGLSIRNSQNVMNNLFYMEADTGICFKEDSCGEWYRPVGIISPLNGCKISPNGHPIVVDLKFMNGHTIVDDLRYSSSNNIYADELNQAKKRYIDNVSAQIVIDGGVPYSRNYNSVGWSISDAANFIVYPLESTAKCINYYTKYGYSLIEIDKCDSDISDLVVYCSAKNDTCGTCENDQYAHVAIKTKVDMPGRYSYNWTSKFGTGWLLTQKNTNSITGKVDDGSSYKPRLCFKKNIGDLPKKQITESTYQFDKKELDTIEKTLKNVNSEITKEFLSVYDTWTSFCQNKYHWNSNLGVCAQGDEFTSVVKFTKEHLNDVKPLIAEKLIDKSEFISIYLYEAVTEQHNDEMISLQEIATEYAHQLIAEISNDSEYSINLDT